MRWGQAAHHAFMDFRRSEMEKASDLRPVAKLVPPQGDKSWSFQIHNRSEAHGDAVLAGMRHEVVARAQPFLQGCTKEWLMVEFWRMDKAVVDAAARHLAQQCGVRYTEGQFTRADLGL